MNGSAPDNSSGETGLDAMTPEATGTDQAVQEKNSLREKISAAGPEERERILQDTVRKEAADVLDQSALNADSNFLEQGLTSLKALELTRNLMALTDVEIPLVAIIEHPTPTQLARFIATTLDEGDGPA
ncbi:acyl carrier protein [Streptomyces sp. A73]|nr:acyl carrier protein [Streptomyces sp. B15]MBQ1162267.1 acyl carrier protein [Streptomyces sp. A73]